MWNCNDDGNDDSNDDDNNDDDDSNDIKDESTLSGPSIDAQKCSKSNYYNGEILSLKLSHFRARTL